MLPNHIIILGGGASVRYLGNLDRVLPWLKDKFCIGINFSYKFIETTCNLGCDETTYNDPKYHADISKLPLWIGKEHTHLKVREPNSIFFKSNRIYNRDLTNGVYRPSLSGIFALSLFVKIASLVSNSNIYLLGFDYGPLIKDGQVQYDKVGKPITHWYQDEFQHRGTGKVSWYQQTGIDEEKKKRIQYAELEFKPFANEKEVKIYTVGHSNIPTFEKIDYEQLFQKKLASITNQNSVRNELKEILLWLKNKNSI